MTTNIQDLSKFITTDLGLGVSDQLEFENQFGQLFIINVLLSVPSQYKNGVENLLQNEVQPDSKLVLEKLTSLGLGGDEAYKFLDVSIRKTLSEVAQKYTDVLSQDTKNKLQEYL